MDGWRKLEQVSVSVLCMYQCSSLSLLTLFLSVATLFTCCDDPLTVHSLFYSPRPRALTRSETPRQRGKSSGGDRRGEEEVKLQRRTCDTEMRLRAMDSDPRAKLRHISKASADCDVSDGQQKTLIAASSAVTNCVDYTWMSQDT
ncbi:hypothetical protein DNTS_028923 [Danionella cerebrum]|uniref:Uncharacterized protein n=1 Tax=Danionella cerebrum TaxID=2873325 RepID=A0A553Q1N6_9TELE|nr:hypothetical protein DNTS_028923 [Danionella translucida]